MSVNDESQPPSAMPFSAYSRATRSTSLYPVVHRLVTEKLRPNPVPQFDGRPVRHWLARQCDQASRDGRTQFYGGDYNRIEICECGRDRSWPTWSEVPAPTWLGETGRAGRRFWQGKNGE